MSKARRKRNDSTLAALLRDKPKRGRPKRSVSRESFYVALSEEQKAALGHLGEMLPGTVGRADVADVAITLLQVRYDELRQAMADRDRELPEGITDIDALYYFWDLPVPDEASTRWTSVRIAPQSAVDFGRIHGGLKALFGANRSQVFSLALALLGRWLESPVPAEFETLDALLDHIRHDS